MEPSTVSSCILTLHKEFAAYTTQRLDVRNDLESDPLRWVAVEEPHYFCADNIRAVG